jgi:DNA-binding beta-propeller fold protein YncE
MKTTKIIYGIALALACGMVATLKAQNIYVANGLNGTVGEYGLDGSPVNASLISGLDYPVGIAISGSDLYVANGYDGNNTIGEYTTSGAVVNTSLISGLNGPWGIAVSGNDLFVANQNNGTVGEYTTSGQTVNASLISGLNTPMTLRFRGMTFLS